MNTAACERQVHDRATIMAVNGERPVWRSTTDKCAGDKRTPARLSISANKLASVQFGRFAIGSARICSATASAKSDLAGSQPLRKAGSERLDATPH